MKIQALLLTLLAAVLLSACSNSRIVSSTEHDDVYYTSKDRTELNTYASDDSYGDSYRQGRVDEYYEEDDFHFSRRMRRFDQGSRNSWRYYDPYNMNDMYYVMNTPSWNTWNNNGWNNWNQPNFGCNNFGYGGFNSFNSFCSPTNTFNNPYFNPWANSYNPYANAYYGYSPFGYNNFGFNNNFYGYGLNPYGNGFNNPYCAGITNVGGFGGTNNPNNWQAYVTQPRNSTQSLGVGNTTRPKMDLNKGRASTVTSTPRVVNSSSSSTYFKPRKNNPTPAVTRPVISRPQKSINKSNTSTTRPRKAVRSTTRPSRSTSRPSRSISSPRSSGSSSGGGRSIGGSRSGGSSSGSSSGGGRSGGSPR